MQQPYWWTWPQEWTDHVQLQLADRANRGETLHELFANPVRLFPGRLPGRWCVESALHGRRWHVIVDVDDDERVLVVVTAYPLDKSA